MYAVEYIYITGTVYITTPDRAALDITGDIELVARVAPATVSVASGLRTLIAKRDGLNGFSFAMYLWLDGQPTLIGNSATNVETTVIGGTPTISDGDNVWYKATRRISDGQVVCSWAADQPTEPSSWNDTTGTDSDAFKSTSAVLGVGAHGDGGLPFTGKMYRAIIRNSIGGTTVADFDASQMTNTSSYTDAYGNVWTLH